MAKMIEIIIAYSLFITVVGARTLSEKAKDFEEELERFLKGRKDVPSCSKGQDNRLYYDQITLYLLKRKNCRQTK